MSLATLQLKPQEERRIKTGHLWIYSNEVDVKKTPLTAFASGQLVQIISNRNETLGIGYINPHNLLCARILTRDAQQNIDQTFFEQKIQQALMLRDNLLFKPFYRLIYGESDFLPGLIVDRYGDVLVVQLITAGMEQLKAIVIAALQNVIKPAAILLRNDSSVRSLEGLEEYVATAYGDPPDLVELEENNNKFLAPIKTGQKTGWFYDHRDNRQRMQKYVKDKRVLDVFSYVGGWGITAAKAGAKEVICVDSSVHALALVQKNAELNSLEKNVKTANADVFDYLKKLSTDQEKFDVIILDPPAFIKKRKDIEAGSIAYQRLNELAVKILNPNGVLITSSCSLLLPQETLVDIMRRISVKTQRPLQILEQGHQALDHPIHPAIPETAYLKALFIFAQP